jgi:Fe-S-cluster-containing hydrogenase component 2
MQARRNGTPMLTSSGYVAQVDVDLCTAYGTCADYCQFAALSLNDDHAVVDSAACMGCGVCVAHCPQEAIALQRDPTKGEPLEIQGSLLRQWCPPRIEGQPDGAQERGSAPMPPPRTAVAGLTNVVVR